MSRLCDLSDESKLWSLLILSGINAILSGAFSSGAMLSGAQNELILSGVQNDFKWYKAIVI